MVVGQLLLAGVQERRIGSLTMCWCEATGSAEWLLGAVLQLHGVRQLSQGVMERGERALLPCCWAALQQRLEQGP